MLNIPANGLNLESSTRMVGPQAQAFAISLSDSAIEDMIKRVQNGEGIQLSLGESPVSRTPRIWACVTMEPPCCSQLHNSLYWEVLCYCVSGAQPPAQQTASPPYLLFCSCPCNPLQSEQSTDRIKFRPSCSATEISKSHPNPSNTTSSDLPRTTPQQSPSFRSPPCRSSVPRGT
jgi:hypothetical protein